MKRTYIIRRCVSRHLLGKWGVFKKISAANGGGEICVSHYDTRKEAAFMARCHNTWK